VTFPGSWICIAPIWIHRLTLSWGSSCTKIAYFCHISCCGGSLRGQDSKWFGYLQSLPRETVDIAIFWGVKDVIDFKSCVCSSRGDTVPSQSAIGDDAGNVGATCSNAEFPESAPSLQYLDGKQARMWLSCTGAKKELNGLMVSTLSL
jgi:hypothetical protein